MKMVLAAAAALMLPTAVSAQQYFVNMVSLDGERSAEYLDLQAQAAEFWVKHDVTLLGRFQVSSEGGTALGDVEHVEIFRVDDMNDFRAYVGDPEYQGIRESRPSLRDRTIVLSGPMSGIGTGEPAQGPVVAVTYHDLGDADRAALSAADAAAADILAQSGAVLLADLDVGEPRESQGAATDGERAVDVVRVWSVPSAETVEALLASDPYADLPPASFVAGDAIR